MSNRGSKRRVYVRPYVGSTINYGFATNISTAQGTILGHAEVGASLPPGYVFGANSPKPARASRRFATGTVSSFISAEAIAAARTAGWRIGFARTRQGGSGNRSRTVYVTLQGIKYAWNIPNTTWANVSPVAGALGIREATQNDDDLVFGADSPKPPRAYTVVGSGDNVSIIQTFYDPSGGQLPEGWTGVDRRRDPSRPRN